MILGLHVMSGALSSSLGGRQVTAAPLSQTRLSKEDTRAKTLWGKEEPPLLEVNSSADAELVVRVAVEDVDPKTAQSKAELEHPLLAPVGLA